MYDGKNKPLTKRGKTVSRYGTCIPNEQSKRLVRLFCYPSHVAPGEAEAECAVLQSRGVVDAVMTQDVDAVMFGSRLTLRDWSKEGTRGNKQPTHVSVLDLERVKERSGLDPDRMILIALLSGGDYNETGVAGIGSGLACEIARAGFGKDLLDVVRKKDDLGLREWRERLQYELHTNESGYFKRRHKSIEIPNDFPDQTILGYYLTPAVSEESAMDELEKKWTNVWAGMIDVKELRQYVGDTFDWLYKGGATKFVRSMAAPLLAQRLLRGLQNAGLTSVESITERRQHFINDGLPELRVSAIPADVVGLDLQVEEDRPLEDLEIAAEEEGDDVAEEFDLPSSQSEAPLVTLSQSPTKKRKSPPWDPYVSEKMWIPETIVQLGTPCLVEEWHQQQRQILMDPKKFATRKCKPKASHVAKLQDTGMKEGAIRTFLKSSKPASVWQLQDTVHYDLPGEDLPEVSDIFGIPKVAPIPAKQAAAIVSSQTSIEDPIVISSSPVSSTVMSAPMTPTKAAVHSEKVAPETGTSPAVADGDLPDTVTRRRRRAARSVQATPTKSPSPQKPDRQLRPIESFFIAAKARSKLENHASKVATNVAVEALPEEPTTGLKTHILDMKVAAQHRNSLPGTWRQVDDTILLMSSPTHSKKRAPRISYVDLADD